MKKIIITIFVGILFCFTIHLINNILDNNYIRKQLSFNNYEYTENILNSLDSIKFELIDTPIIQNKIYSLSKTGKDFIKSHEKCVLHVYNDPDPQRRSIGWGHQLRPGENYETITKQKADELFEIDIEWVNTAINRLISKNDNRFVYTQGFIDGLGSLIYNCGERGVTKTIFYKRWQNCRYDKNAPGFINLSDWLYTIEGVKTSRISAPGHKIRRYNEHLLMLDRYNI